MGGGDDGVSADAAARTVSYSNEGGSSWRGTSSVTIGLDPFRVVEFSTQSSWWGGEDEGSMHWSWDTFSGAASSSTAFCRTGPAPDAGFPPEALGGDTGNNDEPVASTDEVIVPMVTLPAGFVEKGWSTTSFRGCAAHVDGMDLRPHDSWCGARPTGDAEMWVVMSPAPRCCSSR